MCNAKSITSVNKEFCGITDQRKCLDKWERFYMSENNETLREGLSILRSPSPRCFPHGVSVASMGYFRSGSTLLYNTARLWLALGAGEGLAAGYMCADASTVGVGQKGKPQEHCSMLCKDHEMKTGVANNAKVLLMSRRDPFYSVCSRKLMDVWCKRPPSEGPVDRYAINAYNKKCKNDPKVEKEETIKQCRALMKMQAGIYHARLSAGNSIAHDMLMEDYTNDPKKQIQEIALAMGICREAATNHALVEFVAQMGKQLKEHPLQSFDITQMHDVHTPQQREAKCSQLEEWMRSDRLCRQWMDANASSDANGELEKLYEMNRIE